MLLPSKQDYARRNKYTQDRAWYTVSKNLKPPLILEVFCIYIFN